MSTYRERLEAEIVDLRDTLDAARRQREEEHRLRRRAEAKVARVEALADCPPGDCEGHPCIWPEDIRAALAEPERDEEGGR